MEGREGAGRWWGVGRSNAARRVAAEFVTRDVTARESPNTNDGTPTRLAFEGVNGQITYLAIEGGISKDLMMKNLSTYVLCVTNAAQVPYNS
jgi:hypothetical protein